MQLSKIFLLGIKRRIIIYLIVLGFNIWILILAGKQMFFNSNIEINAIYSLFSHLIYFAIFYIPFFLLIIGAKNILNDYLIFTRLTDINLWFKEKLKLLSLDTLFYVILLEIPILFIGIKYLGIAQFLERKNLIFIAADFLMKYIIFFIISIIFVLTSFVSKRQHVGFVTSFFVGGFDFILELGNFDRYAVTLTGKLVEFIISYDLPTSKFLCLSIINCFYLVFLSLFLVLTSEIILKKIDVCRGDSKLTS